MWEPCCVIALVLVSTSPTLAAGNTETSVAPAPLAVSIVLPDGNIGTDSSAIEIGTPTDHFDVVIQNVSDKPQHLWSYGYSWGFDNVSLEVTSVNGKLLAEPIVVAHGASLWSANTPTPFILPPHEMVVREIHLYIDEQVPQKYPARVFYTIPAGEVYANFPPPKKGEREQMTMRAVFQIGPDDWTNKAGVWLGRVVSETKEYTVLWNSRAK